MSQRQWTPQQRAAIEDEGGALLVSAAAGSGKTAVLVERAVRLITREEHPVDADRLLILTFTNAAAAELRSRIGVALEDRIAAEHGNERLARQRLLLRRAFIGTLDAFCQQLVREHFSQLGLPPDISVGEEAALLALRQNALEETMEAHCAQPGFAAFCGLYGRARSDFEAQDAILRLYRFTQALPHPARQLRRFAAMYHGTAPFAETDWGKTLLARAQEDLAACRRLEGRALSAAEADGGLEPWLPALAADAEALGRALSAAEAGDWDGTLRLAQGFAAGRLPAVRGYEGEGKERVQALRKKMKDTLEALCKGGLVCTEAEFEADRAAAAPHVDALCDATADFAARYAEAMLAEGIADFSDFEHLALRLLQSEEGERTPEADRVAGRFDAVMVDEYQDTNALQAALYECLAAPGGSNLFYVGDVKQSIYRFRLANPGIFLARKERWAPWAEGGPHPAVLTLGHNFRSGTGVINGVNYLFERLMSPALGDVDYRGEERLIAGAPGGPAEGLRVQLLADEDGHGDAPWVAAEIARRVREGGMVREGGAERPCGYGDFCVLVRTRGAMPAFVAALEAEGIPVASDAEMPLLQTPEVLPLTAALAAIDNPGDEVALTAAMLGPLFGFTPDELTTLRAAQPAGSLWAAVAAGEGQHAQGFVSALRGWRALAAEMSVGRLLEELVARTGYLSAVSAMAGGAVRRQHVERFLEWAAAVSGEGRGGLAGFVRLLETATGPGQSGFAAVPGQVSLLTIHKSKGLEFPVVFLADTAHGFNRMDAADRVQLHSELGLGLWLRSGHTLYPTAPLAAVRHRCAREALSEEMRVLYVALTRAKDELVVSYAHADPLSRLAAACDMAADGRLDTTLLAGAQCLGDWVLAAAALHPEAAALCAEAGRSPQTTADGAEDCRLALALAEAPPPPSGREAEFALSTPAAPEAVSALLAGFRRAPLRDALRRVPVKVSVSALAKADLPAIRKRPSFLYTGGLTAAERGTAMHSFAQLANFAAARADLEAEIGRLAAEGHLRPEEAKSLDRAGLAALLHSPLAARMEQAQTLLREYDFITALPAAELATGLPEALAGESVMVQGIADLVLVFSDHAELADYKTDRKKDAGMLASAYRMQLSLYAAAIEKRLGLPVTRRSIWSFALAREVEV